MPLQAVADTLDTVDRSATARTTQMSNLDQK
jgi:hypothetical protein